MRILLSTVLAASLLSAPAQADMATAQQAYANGNFVRAMEIWREEAEAGNADAAWYVGNMYVDGLGVETFDPELAVTYYQMAVDRNHVEAKVSLGLLYAQGRGVEEDYHLAMALLYEAAEEGHAVAQVELANYFLSGVPGLVARSAGHAFEWYGLAARQGVVLAQLRYGQMNFDGIGAPQNQQEGLMWLGVARELAAAQSEPYWSHRVFPLDAEIGDEGLSLRTVVTGLYAEYAGRVSAETLGNARNATLVWIAAHSD